MMVTEAKRAHIKANLSEPLLVNDDNHQKEVEVEASLESQSETIEERGTNTNLVTKVSIKASNN
jgi:hypothetical protein